MKNENCKGRKEMMGIYVDTENLRKLRIIVAKLKLQELENSDGVRPKKKLGHSLSKYIEEGIGLIVAKLEKQK